MPKLSQSISRHLVRGLLLAMLVSQVVLAEHLHLDAEQNTDCTVCIFADNSPAPLDSGKNHVAPAGVCVEQILAPAESPLCSPVFIKRSRAPPTHSL